MTRIKYLESIKNGRSPYGDTTIPDIITAPTKVNEDEAPQANGEIKNNTCLTPGCVKAGKRRMIVKHKFTSGGKFNENAPRDLSNCGPEVHGL